MPTGGFLAEFLGYLRTHKRLWLVPIVLVSLLVLLLAGLLFGPATLNALYQIF